MHKQLIRFARSRLADQRGQSLIEFALMMVVLLIMLMGTLDVGRMYFAYVAIHNAAGEGALYAAINPRCVHAGDGPECADPDNAAYRAAHERSAGGVDWERISVEAAPADRSNLLEGQPITITVRYEYSILTPFISPLVQGGKLMLTAHAVQNVIDLKQ